MFKELWEYREMLSSLVKKDLKTRYKGSFLGFLWTFINPLLQLLVYTLLFSVIMRQPGIDNYAMFLFVALVPWIFFSSAVMQGAQCISASAGLLQKIYFPRLILPISVVCSTFVNMLFSFVIVFIALAFSGIGLSTALLLLPVIMIIEFLFTLGMVLIVSSLTVYFKDLEYILGILTQVWMYLTPILYSIDLVPEKLRGVFMFNPMTSVIIAYRDVLYFKQIPDLSTMISTVACAAVAIVVGIILFNKLQKRFVEEL